MKRSFLPSILLVMMVLGVLGFPTTRRTFPIQLRQATGVQWGRASWEHPWGCQQPWPPEPSREGFERLAQSSQDHSLWLAAGEQEPWGEWDKTVTYYDRAIELAPDQAELYARKATRALYSMWVDVRESGEPPDTALVIPVQLEKNGPWTTTNVRDLLATIEKGAALEPQNAFFGVMRAHGLLAVGSRGEAMTCLDDALAKPFYDDHSLDVYPSLRAAYVALGAPAAEATVPAASQVSFLQISPFSATSRIVTGYGLEAERAGHHRDALDYYERMMKLGAVIRDMPRATWSHVFQGHRIQTIGWGTRYALSDEEEAAVEATSIRDRVWHRRRIRLSKFAKYTSAQGRSNLADYAEREFQRNIEVVQMSRSARDRSSETDFALYETIWHTWAGGTELLGVGILSVIMGLIAMAVVWLWRVKDSPLPRPALIVSTVVFTVFLGDGAWNILYRSPTWGLLKSARTGEEAFWMCFAATGVAAFVAIVMLGGRGLRLTERARFGLRLLATTLPWTVCVIFAIYITTMLIGLPVRARIAANEEDYIEKDEVAYCMERVGPEEK